MLFSGDNPILQIIGIEHMCWKSGVFNVAPREYSALTFRISGSATIRANGEEYFVNTNDILYLPQNIGYTAEYSDTEIIVAHFLTLWNDEKPELYTFQNGEQIYKLFLQAHALWKTKEPGFARYVMAQLYTILGTLLENEVKTVLPQHFLKAVSYMNSNYKNVNLHISMVCTEAGIGATVFRQLFKKHYQKTPTEYITELRLQYARNLISGGMPIETAACESGFNDPKYFARVVKKYYGCTPRDLRTYGK